MGLVFSHRWDLLCTGREGSFCHGQWTMLAVWAGRAEETGCSAIGAEASASAFLVDALPFGLFLSCREVHVGRAVVNRVAGDVGGR